MPGPASTVGERPPTNPAIRVRFPPEADDDTSFSPLYAILCETAIYRNTLHGENKRRRHLLEKKAVFNSLSV